MDLTSIYPKCELCQTLLGHGIGASFNNRLDDLTTQSTSDCPERQGSTLALLDPTGYIWHSDIALMSHIDFREVIIDDACREAADHRFRKLSTGEKYLTLNPIVIGGRDMWMASEVDHYGQYVVVKTYQMTTPLIASDREVQLAVLLGQGMAVKMIASRLWISLATARSHIEKLREKFGLQTTMELAVACARRLRGTQILIEVRGIEFPGPKECAHCTQACTVEKCKFQDV